jgi:hypothetical protein
MSAPSYPVRIPTALEGDAHIIERLTNEASPADTERVRENEHTFLIGGLVPIGELLPSITPAEEDFVEFVQPSVPGRTVVLHELPPDEESS